LEASNGSREGGSPAVHPVTKCVPPDQESLQSVKQPSHARNEAGVALGDREAVPIELERAGAADCLFLRAHLCGRGRVFGALRLAAGRRHGVTKLAPSQLIRDLAVAHRYWTEARAARASSCCSDGSRSENANSHSAAFWS
jgi:hypothetical protein